MKKFKKVTAALIAFSVAATAMTPAGSTPSGIHAASKVTLNKKSAEITVGKTVQLKVKGTKKKIKWSSSNTYVAKVTQKGKVTGGHTGSAKITAKTGSKKLVCKIKVKAKKKAEVTEVPFTPTTNPETSMPENTATVTEVHGNPASTETATEMPVKPENTPTVPETPVIQTVKPVVPTATVPTQKPEQSQQPATGAPGTERPTVPETPGKQVDLALNFYLDPFEPEKPNEQYVTVHLVNHLEENVYVETDAYLTTKGKDYPAMLTGMEGKTLEKIEPTSKDDTFGQLVTYDDREIVMGNWTGETVWLPSDENSTLTFYFHIEEQRYRAVINYNEIGAIFREASKEETLLPVVTETPIVPTPAVPTQKPEQTQNPATEAPATEQPVVTETLGKQVDLALNFYLDPFDPEKPNEQFVTVHFVNHLQEDVYVEKDAYLTTKGKDYPAMMTGNEGKELRKIEPIHEGEINGESMQYDSKEYVMGDWTEETLWWLPSDENSTLTFYFRIGEQRYKATINYNETGAVFREATSEETLLPVVTAKPVSE